MKKLTLSEKRIHYSPKRPPSLSNLPQSIPELEAEAPLSGKGDPEIAALFPFTEKAPSYRLKERSQKKPIEPPSSPLKVAVLFSGGQAPGGHNVVAGLFDALKELHPDSRLIGFLKGPEGLIKNDYLLLDEEKIRPYRNQGGFHLLGSGRTKIEKEEQFLAAAKTIESHSLDGLLIIGGDDSNTNAAFLAEYCAKEGMKTSIIGVPKTIDGDLKNEWIETSFGFDTASKVYSEFIGNCAIDALSARKYYFFIKVMGRSASSLALECAMQTHPNLLLVGEEIAKKGQTLSEVVKEVAQLIRERAKIGKKYGVILIPEGILESMRDCQKLLQELNLLSSQHEGVEAEQLKQKLSTDALESFHLFPKEIQSQLFLERDPHGNIQLTKIETERLLLSLVQKELEGEHTLSFNPQPLFCGYEGRSGLPSNFDCDYGYSLGCAAALFIHYQLTGYIVSIKHLAESVNKWEVRAIPILRMLHFEERKGHKKAVIKKGLVDLEGPLFRAFSKEREAWRLEDGYQVVGPIQFEGEKEITEQITETLKYETGDYLSL